MGITYLLKRIPPQKWIKVPITIDFNVSEKRKDKWKMALHFGAEKHNRWEKLLWRQNVYCVMGLNVSGLSRSFLLCLKPVGCSSKLKREATTRLPL
jgi:hypothetical protein